MGDTPSKLELRQAFGAFPTGVAIVTCLDDDGAPVGVTVNSFVSVSLEPPLVLWGIRAGARSQSAFLSSPGFIINILSCNQRGLADAFCRPGDRFSGVRFRLVHGLPMLSGCSANIVCDLVRVETAGDHDLLFGQVLEVKTENEPSLVFAGSRYGRFEPSVDSAVPAWLDLPDEGPSLRLGAVSIS